MFSLCFHCSFIPKIRSNNLWIFFNILISNILCNLGFLLYYWFWRFSGSGVFTALQKPLRLWIYLSVCCVISKLQSGHLTISLSLYIFMFFFNYNWLFFKCLYCFFYRLLCKFNVWFGS